MLAVRRADAPLGAEQVTQIVLPFPPASLSGHAKGHWRDHAKVTKAHRAAAKTLTIEALGGMKVNVPPRGDIGIRIAFMPADNRSDRTNFAGRMKPYIDGIAEALGVNDKRFLPEYAFLPPCPPGAVIVTVEGV